MQNNARYWIWLSQALGYGSSKIKTIMRFYSSIEDFYIKGEQEWLLCGCFSRKELVALSEHTIEEAEQILKRAISLEQNVITPDDSEYPQLLKEIFNPPAVLYTKGNIAKLSNCLCIGIVGTRTATVDGLKTAFNFGYDLSKQGVVVVSGGALGVDCSSHKGVLQAGGVTACVLGCGINYNYLMTNSEIRKAITINGVLISEYPPDSPATNWNFPMRNRIIAGLSKGILVIEAGEKSGSLITARLALEENRDVFAIPGSINNINAAGTNNLIKLGAIPVTNYTDILNEYSSIYKAPNNSINIENTVDIQKTFSEKKQFNNKNKVQKENTRLIPTGLSHNATIVYNVIEKEPQNIDSIIIKAKLPTNNVLAAITELEFSGLIAAIPGARYKIVIDTF